MFHITEVNIEKEARHHRLIANAGASETMINTMHGHLDVIDTKTSVLLTFNGVLIAIFAILVAKDAALNIVLGHEWLKVLLVMGFVGVVISTFFCLSSLNIIGAHSNKDRTIDEYIKYTAWACASRTRIYISALLITRISCGIILPLFVLKLFYV